MSPLLSPYYVCIPLDVYRPYLPTYLFPPLNVWTIDPVSVQIRCVSDPAVLLLHYLLLKVSPL